MTNRTDLLGSGAAAGQRPSTSLGGQPQLSSDDLLRALAALLAPLLQPLPQTSASDADEPKASSEPSIQKLALTVTSFCKAHEISTPTYYRLRREGKGPREMRVGSDIRISVEAAADWRRAREEEGHS